MVFLQYITPGPLHAHNVLLPMVLPVVLYSTDILTHEDAGVHTCSVRDGNGNMGFATTEIELYGMILTIKRYSYTKHKHVE